MAVTSAVGDLFKSFYELFASLIGAFVKIFQTLINAIVGFFTLGARAGLWRFGICRIMLQRGSASAKRR